jgi:hypothetical protein
MPEASQINFKHKEVLELLIRHAKIHEGRWMLSVSFNFGAGNIGPSVEETNPTAFVSLANIGIAKASRDAPESLVLDAAVVNPAKKR